MHVKHEKLNFFSTYDLWKKKISGQILGVENFILPSTCIENFLYVGAYQIALTK